MQQLKHLAQRGGPKKKMVNFKVSEREYMDIVSKARKYSGGNMSDWIRYAATKYEPSKSELEVTPDPTPSSEPQTEQHL